LKKTFVNIFSGAVGYILPIGLNIFFTPIIIKNLGSEAYGLQSLVNVIIGFLMVADMGLDIPVTKLVSEYSVKENPIMLNKLLNTTLQVYLGIGFLGALIIFIITPFLVDSVFSIPPNMHEHAKYVFYLAALGFIGGLLNMWGQSVFNGILRYDISNSINLVTTIISILIGTFFVIRGYGVVVYVFVRVLFTFLSGIVYLIVSKYFLSGFKITLGINKEIWNGLKNQLGYGFFLRFSGIITSRFDQFLIGAWIGVAAVGYYSIAILIVTSIGGLINSMIHFIFPKMSQLNSSGNIEKLEELFIAGSKFVGVLVFFIIPPFILISNQFLSIWLGKDVAKQAYMVLVLLFVAALIQTIFVSVLNNYIIGIGKLKLFTKYTLVRSVVFLLLCFLLIKKFGLLGAGYAMIGTTLVDVVFYILIVYKDFKKHAIVDLIIYYFKLLLISLFTCVICWFTYVERIDNFGALLVYAFIFGAIFTILTILFRLFNNDEIKLFKSVTNRILIRIPFVK
jgi:O-antigen/teichoic acid export membrane protein